MTLKQMRSKLQWLNGQKTGGERPPIMWNEELTDAQQQLCSLGLIVDRWCTCDTVVDQTDYTIPSYVNNLLGVEVYDSGNSHYSSIVATTLEILNKTNADWRGDSSATVPTQYFRKGYWLGIYPTFDAIVADGIKLIYERLGDTLSDDGDISYIPAQFHKYIVLQAFVNMFPDHKNFAKCERQLGAGMREMWDFTHSLSIGHLKIIRPAR